jgi:hypothetical protein
VTPIERGYCGWSSRSQSATIDASTKPRSRSWYVCSSSGGAGEVRFGWVCESVCAADDVGDEVGPYLRSAELGQPVVDLDQDRGGNQ